MSRLRFALEMARKVFRTTWRVYAELPEHDTIVWRLERVRCQCSECRQVRLKRFIPPEARPN